MTTRREADAAPPRGSQAARVATRGRRPRRCAPLLVALASLGACGPDANERNGFDIDVVIPRWVDDSVRDAITDAALRWAAILEDTEFENVILDDGADCRGIDVGGEFVDDVMILVRLPFEIPSSVAQAGICAVRAGSHAPIVGHVSLDRSRLGELEEEGVLEYVALHEIGHVLGFGVTWNDLYLLGETPNPHFTGPLARAAFDSAGGTDFAGAKVPVDRDHGHWSGVLGGELMTRSLVGEGVLSAVTIQALADMGYQVDLSLAQDFHVSVSGSRAARGPRGPTVDLGRDLDRGPVTIVVTGH